MYGGKSTLYDILEISRDATAADIGRAYRRRMAELQKEDVAPDPRLAVLLREAHEVLSDPQKREAYDRSLRGPTFLGIPGGASPGRRWSLVVVGVFALLGGLYYAVVRESPSPDARHPPTVSAQEIHTAVSVAMGRVHRIDLSGQSTPLGAAVAIEEGLMMTPCEGLHPGAELVVRIPPRAIPGRIARADEPQGLCQLRMHAGGSWPMPLTALAPRPREKVYVARFDSKGEVAIAETEVERLASVQHGTVVEVADVPPDLVDGSPLIDASGRVVAIARAGRHLMLPAAWIDTLRPPLRRPPEATREPQPEAPAADAAPPQVPGPEISPQRREALEKAFRPPPKIPDDI